jgi:hypothetical protein
MKKKIESELISIAHKLLKINNYKEIVQLHEEVKKLYEQLTLLKFYEENTSLVNETFSKEAFEEKVEKIIVGTIEIEEDEEEVEIASKENIVHIEEELFENTTLNHDLVPENKKDVADESFEDQKTEDTIEKVDAEESIIVAEELQTELKSNEPIIGTKATKQIALEDLLAADYKEPIFEKKDNATPISADVVAAISNENVTNNPELPNKSESNTAAEGKAITLGINDKIAFEKNLFNGNVDDLNRVISQLNTFTSFSEAKSFVLDFVKPDYNDWKGKEEFETMFLETIENKFKS